MRSARRQLVMASCAVATLGVVYALVVPLGLPYDEPSHWQNVLHLARTGSLYEIGGDDVGYEAVQGPLAYVVDALVAAPFDAMGVSTDITMRIVRVANVGWLVALLVALAALTHRLMPRVSSANVVLAATLVAGSPILVAVGSSVQNDVPATVLSVMTLVVFIDGWHDTGWRRHAAVGALLGLAFLTKASVWPVGVVLGLTLLVRRRPAQLVAFVAAGLVVAGWWVLRNLHLYDSLTGNNAVKATGFEWPPVGFDGITTFVDLGRTAVTFLWVPVEYWRNTVAAPTWVEALIAVVTLAIVGLAGAHVRRPDGVETTVLLVGAAAVIAWVFITTMVEGASFRLTYVGVLPVWAWTMANAVSRSRGPAWALVAVTMALHAFAVVAVMGA